jgi:hypothetical protein
MPTQASQPRISLNKLGEYLATSDEARHRRIIYDQKFPTGIITKLYGSFPPSVRDVLVAGAPISGVLEAAQRLKRQATAWKAAEATAAKSMKWYIDNANNTAGALERFALLAPQLVADSRTFLPPPRKDAFVLIEGVKISIKPDYIVHQNIGGRPHLGAVKFHLIKNVKKHMGAVGAQHVAVLLQHWLEINLPDAARLPHHTLCLVVECWQNRVTSAPAKYEGRMENIAHACHEIAEIWPTIHRIPDAA